MIVCGVSRCVDDWQLWVGDSERFCDIPACQRVGEAYIGYQEIDFLGFMERLQRTDARSRLQYPPPLLPEVGHYVLADYPIIFDHENSNFSGTLQCALQLSPGCWIDLNVGGARAFPGQGLDLLETRGWDDLASGVTEA